MSNFFDRTMRRYNDALIFILANLPMWLGPRQEPRRRPCRRAKYADRATGAARHGKPRSASRSFASKPPSGPARTARGHGLWHRCAGAEAARGSQDGASSSQKMRRRSLSQLSSSASNPIAGAMSGIVRIPHCSAASIACARCGSRFFFPPI